MGGEVYERVEEVDCRKKPDFSDKSDRHTGGLSCKIHTDKKMIMTDVDSLRVDNYWMAGKRDMRIKEGRAPLIIDRMESDDDKTLVEFSKASKKNCEVVDIEDKDEKVLACWG
jgi:hypothetical protein